MASITPFRALRPAPEAAAAVSCVPYDVVSTDEARQLAAGNPLSFLHVTRSEIDLAPDADPYGVEVYDTARASLDRLRLSAPLIVEDTPSLYFYRLRMGSHEQIGVAGGFSLEEYRRDIIKKHERTRRDKEDDRTRHIAHVRAQTGVVFLTYRASAAVDALEQKVTAGAPIYDFTAPDDVHHTVWRADAADTAAIVAAVAAIPALYIADGHHRAASAARAAAELAASSRDAGAGTFIAVAFPDNQVQILPYHRIVKDLAGATPAEFLGLLRERLPIRGGSATPARKGEVSMYINREWHTIDLTAAIPQGSSPAAALDVALLQSAVLEPILRIGDIRTDKRIDFVGGARGTDALERAVDTGKAAVAFSMFPVSVEDLLTISDDGGIMPPKSTWFEPKLRDGLLIHAFGG